MIANPQVVITGIGVVSPIGVGRRAMTESLLEGRSGIRPLTRYDASAMQAPFGGEVVDFDPKELVRPRKSLKVMSRDIQLGFAAAELALEDAALDTSSVHPDRKGVVFGADFIYGELEDLVPTYQGSIIDRRFHMERWGAAMAEIYPLWMLKNLPNMIACHVAIAHDARGHCNTIVLSEVSSLLAIAEAARAIERGAADVMIAGGASCNRLSPTAMTYRGDKLLSTRHGAPETACRPFDARRDGMVNGEGAAAFVLESAEHARRRGAHPIAAWLGFASRSERIDDPLQSPTGAAMRSAINGALTAARVAPADIGHVNASGLSTVVHDAAEAQAIKAILGDTPVTAPKSYFGHLGAATGAVEMATTLIALATGSVPPTLNYEEPDPACPVNVVASHPLENRPPTALLLNQTLLGHAVAALISRVD